jgi:hypothetical protein
MLRKIFGHTKAEVREVVCVLNAELYSLHCSTNISDQIKVGVLKEIYNMHGRDKKCIHNLNINA